MMKRRARTIAEWAERMQSAEPPTDDDVTILLDGRQLNSKEAVEAWLREVEDLRAQKVSIRDVAHKRTTSQP